ncbi:MAG: proline--tRNA ligase [bacterium]|nr:proline--tRNA ligase [bacterium]
MSKEKTAISPTRADDYPEWYQQVIKAADLAENSPARGCMVIKPWGWGIWEKMQKDLDGRIKATGHENAYFPLFIPLSFLEKEAAHVEGFAKECAVVTHHRLEERDGKLIPTGELEEPLIVRPTSETIIGDAYSKWVQSYRDLPILINQWANVVRWEMRPRLFLRTAEFLWQEGHTVHASETEALEEVFTALEMYRSFSEEVLAIPVITGEKTPGERFPGADNTYCIEAMMQDKKALQAGTSHYLGQNFAKSSGIRFLDRDSELKYAFTTSWGVSTRLIGALIMTHSDDNGLRLPPRVAPKQVIILPVVPDATREAEIFAYAEEIAANLRQVTFFGSNLDVHIDKRDIRGGEKNWQWIKKGAPVRIEVGPRDLEKRAAVLYRRDQEPKEKHFLSFADITTRVPEILAEMQNGYLNAARVFRDENIRTDIKDFDEFRAFFTPKDMNKPEIHGGFVLAHWCEDDAVEATLAELKVTIRCIPLEQDGSTGRCVITGRPATKKAIFAKAY